MSIAKTLNRFGPKFEVRRVNSLMGYGLSLMSADLNQRSKELAAQINATHDPALRKKLTGKLQKVVEETFDARQRTQKDELTEMRARIALMQRKLNERESRRKEIVGKRVDDLLDPAFPRDMPSKAPVERRALVQFDVTIDEKMVDALQGEWEYVWRETDGVRHTFVQPVRLVIDGNQWRRAGGPPLRVDVLGRNAIFYGMPGNARIGNLVATTWARGYIELKDNTLRYCQSSFEAPGIGPGPRAPGGMSTKGTRNTAYQLRRVTAEPHPE